MSRIGERLREARQARGESLADVGARLDVPPEWLADLEEGNFAAFGNEVHAHANLRLYAAALQLDANELLQGEQLQVPSTGRSFEPRVAGEATRAEQVRFLTSQILRSPETVQRLLVICGLLALAGIGVLIVRLGGA